MRLATGGIALVAALAFLAACAATRKEPPPKPFAGTRWQVQLEVPLAGEQPNMRFGDGRVEGFRGCNKFAAHHVQDIVGGRAILSRPIEVDRRLCEASPHGVEGRMLV